MGSPSIEFLGRVGGVTVIYTALVRGIGNASVWGEIEKMKNNLKITTSVVALMAGLPSATLAQQLAIEEIVVTARQRAETLQEMSFVDYGVYRRRHY